MLIPFWLEGFLSTLLLGYKLKKNVQRQKRYRNCKLRIFSESYRIIRRVAKEVNMKVEVKIRDDSNNKL